MADRETSRRAAATCVDRGGRRSGPCSRSAPSWCATALPGREESLVRAVNDLPNALSRLLWPFQQLGVLFAGPIVAITAVVLRRYRLTLAALLVTAANLGSERIVTALVTRERPATPIRPDNNTRGDVGLSGESFVYGHALVAALAGKVTPYLPGHWRLLPWVLVGVALFARVYVGAHNPLDVVCGAALGVAIAAGINLAVGHPSHIDGPRRPDQPIPRSRAEPRLT